MDIYRMEKGKPPGEPSSIREKILADNKRKPRKPMKITYYYSV